MFASYSLHSRRLRLLGAALAVFALAGCGKRDLVLSQSTNVVMMEDDGDNRRVALTSVHGNSAPVWSPSGSQIAFADMVRVSGCCDNLDIFVASKNGSGRTNLTEGCAISPVDDCNDLNPHWSSNGIVFEREAMTEDVIGPAEIFSVDANGANLRRLTDNVGSDVEPTWSPDGSKVAFASDRNGNYEIYIMDYPSGGNLVQVTSDPADDRSPSWGKATLHGDTGEWIAFVSTRDGNEEIYMATPDGSTVRRVTNDPARDWSPSWMPDGGSFMAALSDRTGSPEVFILTVNGADKQLTRSGSAKQHVSWGPEVR